MAQAFAFIAVSALVSTGISYMFPSDGPRIKDLKVTSSTYGNIIPEVFGSARVAGNMIWSNPILEKKKKKKAGKGGSYYNEYTYSCDFAMAFARGPVQDIRRIWADGKLIYDTTGGSEVVNNAKYKIRIYKGDEEQLPDPIIEAAKGVGTTPAYRGLCYVCFDGFQLADFGNRIPQMAAEVYVGDGGTTTSSPIEFQATGSHAYQNNQSVIDPARGYAYVFDAGTPKTIRRIRIGTNSEDRQIVGVATSPTSIYDDGALSSINAAGKTGCIYGVVGGANNYMKVVKLDPYSYAILSSIGQSFPFHDNDVNENNIFFSDQSFVVGYDLRGGEYLMTIGVFGDLALINGDQMAWVSYETATHIGPYAARNGCARAALSDSGPIFYLLSGGDSSAATISTSFSLQRFGASAGAWTIPIDNATTGCAPSWCVWDNGNPGVVFFYTDGAQDWVAKWSEDTLNVVWRTPVPSAITPFEFNAAITNNELAWIAGGKLWLINTATGEWVDRQLDLDFYMDEDDRPQGADLGNTDGANGYPIPNDCSDQILIFDSTRNVLLCLGGATDYAIYVGRYAAQSTSVGSIVERLLRRSGQFLTSDFDLTPLYDISVRGYGFAASTDIKSIIGELKNLFMFDLVESDGVLKARLRGDTVADESISYRVLSDGSSEDDNSDYWRETRMSEADLPASIDLVYMNIDDDYQPSTAKSKRTSTPYPTMYSRQQAKMEANLVMDATEAKNRVNVMLYSAWGERTKHETTMPWAYAYLDPADLISVTAHDGRNYFERISSTEFGADFSLRAETYGSDSGAYLSDHIGDGGGAGRNPIVEVPKPAIPFILNLPLLRDSDGDGGAAYSLFYSAIGNGAPGTFNGATMFRATNGQDYDDLYQETAEAEWGTVSLATPTASHGFFALDWETRITIFPAVDWFELESITDDELWAGGNPCVIGSEVIQFRDAVENLDGSWTIWNLLRGRRGTEWACDTHVAGEHFIFLDVATVEPQAEAIDASGKNRWFKAVGSGRNLLEATPVQINYQPRDLMPYAVNDIRRTVVGSDLTLTWKRRTRLGGGMQDGTGTVALSEATEAYEVYLLNSAYTGDKSRQDAPLAAQIVRQYATITPTVTYTAAEMATDGYDVNLDTLHVVIYQLSAAVGRGFPSARSIESWQDF